MTLTEIRELIERATPQKPVPMPEDQYGYRLITRKSLVRKGQMTVFIVAPQGRHGQWKLDNTTLRLAKEGELYIHHGD